MGLQCEAWLLLWIRDPEFIWTCDREGREPREREAGILALRNVADGRYAARGIETTTNQTV